MVHISYLMALLPLGGFLVLAFGGRRLGDPLAGWIGTLAVFASFVIACISLAGLLGEPAAARHFSQNYFSWIVVGGLRVKVGILLDPLSMTMAMFVTGVSTLIHLYSIGYMKGDSEFPKFFNYLNLFVFSMLVLVLANNLLVTFVGWEGVGLCSYLLIAYWHERGSAIAAGKKAFVYNRVGDVGFLIAVFLVFSKTGTLGYEEVFAHRHLLGDAATTAVVLLFLLAATGKSAQIPLFNWLPDAMEGPTPVSALIHAATMVTAGVYLLCRINSLLVLSPDAMWVIAVIGGVTAFVAATIASSQQDIKKVLAFSTVSQIGYMMLAVGVGAYIAAIFLMVAHAFYKGLLFLGAGSVIHGLHDEQDLKKMGALAKLLPWTYVTFISAWLAIAGIPPLSGFWSKGDVLANTFDKSHALWALGVVTAVLTAYYMTRLFVLAFHGDPRWEHAVGGRPQPRPHESPWVMRIPLIVLAVLAFVAGVLDLPWIHNWGLASWLAPVFAHTLFNDHEGDALQIGLIVIDGVAAVLGLGLAAWAWRSRVDSPRLEPAFLQRVWYWDDLYDLVIGRPGQVMARITATVVEGAVLDGAVNGAALVVRKSASALRHLQSGYVRNYALGIAIGVAAIVAFAISQVWWS
ncbi:MAG: NADH-quinone oxidoreductase subunit L [Acidimicrobiales bacterium]